MTTWTPQTQTIINKHNRDFNIGNYASRIKVLGGYDKYVNSLGLKKPAKVTTVSEFRQMVEYVMALMAIWGIDYYNGKTYWRWGQGSGTKATPDAFRTSGKGKCASGDLKKILNTPTIVTTNCNYGVDTFWKACGKSIWSCDYDKVIKSGAKWITKKSDLKPGDMVHFWSKTYTKANWKHIAIVVEVKDGKVWMADFGNRFVKQRKPYHYMPVDHYTTAGGEYGSYVWKGVRKWTFVDDTPKPAPAPKKQEVKIVKSPLATYQNISPNSYGQRNHSIDRITPHCYVGKVTAKQGVDYFKNPNLQASCNYVIGTDAIGLCVPENYGSWCSSNMTNDMRAITIECASETASPYAFPAATYNMLVNLCVDICKRYGKKKLLWFGSREKTLAYTPKSDEMVLTVHRWFAQKACPGDWMMSKMPELAAVVTKRLNPEEEIPVPKTIKIGSKGKLVKWLQVYLGGLTVDGKFGAKTKAALIKWQKAKGVANVGQPDGVCGPKTWRYILKSMQ